MLLSTECCVRKLGKREMDLPIYNEDVCQNRPWLKAMGFSGTVNEELQGIEVHFLWLVAFFLDLILLGTNFWTNPSKREEFNQRTEALTWDMCNSSPATEGVGRRSIDVGDVNQAQYIQHKLRIFCGRSFQCHSFLVRAQNIVPDTVSCRYASVFYCTPCSKTGPSQCPRSLRYDNGSCGSIQALGDLRSASAFQRLDRNARQQVGQRVEAVAGLLCRLA